MNPLRLSELEELLRTAAFAAWWTKLARAEATCKTTEVRRQELETEARLADLRAEAAGKLAADAFSRAGEIGGQAAELAAEAQQLENRALERVAVFEEQRYKVSSLWYRLGDAERVLEEGREALQAGAAEPQAVAAAQVRSLLEHAERQHVSAREEYEREAREKARLWAEVESAWERSFELSLLGAERGASVQPARREAERFFEEAEKGSARARQLREEAAAAAREGERTAREREELLAQAREQFHCIVGQYSLYWGRQGDPKGAWAVPLGAPGADVGASVPNVLAVFASGGELRFESAREDPAAPDEGEHRFEEWLLALRRGNAR